MTTNKTILIIEDEAGIRTFIRNALGAAGYRTVEAENGARAKALMKECQPSLVLLDLGLPDIEGITLLRELRGWADVPVIIVSARDAEEEKVLALDMGADDYVTKPFGISELMARVRTALRHAATENEKKTSDDEIYVKDLVINIPKHTVTKAGEEIHFTQNEFKCLELLARCTGKVLTYDYIMRTIWGPYSPGDNQILRVNMANIRRKLKENPAEPKYILTELGIGYRMLGD